MNIFSSIINGHWVFHFLALLYVPYTIVNEKHNRQDDDSRYRPLKKYHQVALGRTQHLLQ